MLFALIDPSRSCKVRPARVRERNAKALLTTAQQTCLLCAERSSDESENVVQSAKDWAPFEGMRFVCKHKDGLATASATLSYAQVKQLITLLGGTLLTQGERTIVLANTVEKRSTRSWSSLTFFEKTLPPPAVALEWLKDSSAHATWVKAFAPVGLQLGAEASLAGIKDFPRKLTLDVHEAHGADFSGTHLRETFFRGAHEGYGAATFQRVEWNRAAFRGAFLEKVSFYHVHFAGADFRDATLQGVRFAHCTFTDCLFEGANLDAVTFKNPSFSSGISLHGATLSDCTIDHFTYDAKTDHFNARGADLSGLTLSGYFRGGDFANAKVPNTDPTCIFENCDLRGADFSGADLSFAQFHSSQLSQTKFSGSRLDYAVVAEKELAEAVAVPPRKLGGDSATLPSTDELRAALSLWEKSSKEGMIACAECTVPGAKLQLWFFDNLHPAGGVLTTDDGRTGKADGKAPRELSAILEEAARMYPNAVLGAVRCEIPRKISNGAKIREAVRLVLTALFPPRTTPEVKKKASPAVTWPSVDSAITDRLLKDRNDREAWRAYADACKRQDALLAELITRKLAIETAPSDEEREERTAEHFALFEQNFDRWVGSFRLHSQNVFYLRPGDYGFFDTVFLSTKARPLLEELLEHPGSILLREVKLSVTKLEPFVDLLAKRPVEVLYLDAKKHKDVSVLAGLTSLRELHVCNGETVDLSSLRTLTSLQVLTLDKVPLGDLDELSSLKQLCVLGLYRSMLPRAATIPTPKTLTEVRVFELEQATTKLEALPKRVAVRKLAQQKELPFKLFWR